MFGHYLTTLYRSLARHRLYAAINVLGLAVGIAGFLLLGQVVRFQTSFEQWVPHASQLYVIQHTWHQPGEPTTRYPITMGALLDELRADFPQTQGARMWGVDADIQSGGAVTTEQGELVDPNLFSIFDLPFVAGDRSTALLAPNNVVISQAMARKYFGGAPALGQKLTVTLRGMPGVYTVAGVVKDPPKATELSFDVLVPISPRFVQPERGWDYWGTNQLYTYLRFASADEAAAYAHSFAAFIDRHGQRDLGDHASRQFELSLAPLTSLHLSDPSDAAAVAALGLVGLLALLVAALNYVNLATAGAALRAREVAVRKVVGASRGVLTLQFLAEAMITAALASAIGVAMAEVTLPFINAVGGTSLTFGYLDPLGPIVLALCAVIVIGLAAGAWPAFVLSRFQPAAVLASVRSPTGGPLGARIREGLVALQFAIAIALVIMTAVLAAQVRHIATANLGFNREGVITVASFMAPQAKNRRSALLDLWRREPGVTGVTVSDTAPAGFVAQSDIEMHRPGVANLQPSLSAISIGPDFFQLYGVPLLAGRTLDRVHSEDDVDQLLTAKAKNANVVLNLSAARAMGFRNAAEANGQPLLVRNGHVLLRLTVAGVVGDVRFGTPRAPIRPTVYIESLRDFPSIAAVRFSGVAPPALLGRLAADWRRLVPDAPFDAQTVDQTLQTFSRPEAQRASLFSLGAAMAVAIGCVGLFGLASFSAARRVHEMGIRKTLGASAGDIGRLLIVQFLRPVLLANLLAWPLAYLAARAWLSGFDDRIALGPLYFIAPAILALAIAAVTVIGQTLRLARADPAAALRQS